jgi:hypothetical protein
MNIHHPTLRFMHRWISMTLFARQDIRFVYHAELQILYAMLKNIKISPVKEMFKHRVETFKASTSISCTSLVTRIAANIGALDGQDVTYISTPCIDIDEHYLMQGHLLKYDEIPLPNMGFSLYKFPSLTFTLVEQEEACRSSVSRRGTRSKSRDEAGSSQQSPTPTPLVPQAFHMEWFPAMKMLGFTPRYLPGSGQTLPPHKADGSGWHEADDAAWAHHSSDSEGLPPLVHPRQSTLDRREVDGINTRLEGLEIHTGEIQNTLNTHVQDTRQWHQQQQQQFADINALLRQQHEAQGAY